MPIFSDTSQRILDDMAENPDTRGSIPARAGGTPWQIDSAYSPLFTKGAGCAVSYQVNAVGIHDFLGRVA